jgi:hypothetical protein
MLNGGMIFVIVQRSRGHDCHLHSALGQGGANAPRGWPTERGSVTRSGAALPLTLLLPLSPSAFSPLRLMEPRSRTARITEENIIIGEKRIHLLNGEFRPRLARAIQLCEFLPKRLCRKDLRDSKALVAPLRGAASPGNSNHYFFRALTLKSKYENFHTKPNRKIHNQRNYNWI